MITEPLLTIAVPTYRRVDLLRRCLQSVVPTVASTVGDIELVVSDNSPEDDVEHLIDQFRHDYPAPLHYYRNPESTGAVNNFNLCIERAQGRYLLILHDDDYLLPGAIDGMMEILRDADAKGDQVVLFGVRVEDRSGRVRRTQDVKVNQTLEPRAAVKRMLRDASFVRVPGLVVTPAAYKAVGSFRVEAYTTCDTDMAAKLFGRFGVRLAPLLSSAYMVHEGSVTTTVFTPRTVALIFQVFYYLRSLALLDGRTMDRLECNWMHQFILGGTWRALESRDLRGARQVYRLFDLPRVRALGISQRWLPVRAAFALATGAVWRRRDRTAVVGSAADASASDVAGTEHPDIESAGEW
ncbi:glycosyltransferase [soil metagenome]